MASALTGVRSFHPKPGFQPGRGLHRLKPGGDHASSARPRAIIAQSIDRPPCRSTLFGIWIGPSRAGDATRTSARARRGTGETNPSRHGHEPSRRYYSAVQRIRADLPIKAAHTLTVFCDGFRRSTSAGAWTARPPTGGIITHNGDPQGRATPCQCRYARKRAEPRRRKHDLGCENPNTRRQERPGTKPNDYMGCENPITRRHEQPRTKPNDHDERATRLASERGRVY